MRHPGLVDIAAAGSPGTRTLGSVSHPTGRLRDLLRSGAGIAVAMGVMNVCTYAFTILCSRLLGPSEYGAVASLMGILLIVNVLSLGLQATGARRVASAPEERDRIEAEVLAAAWRAAIVLALVCLALTPVITAVLSLDSWLAGAMIGAAALPLTVMGGYAGILQGEHRWLSLGGIYLAMGVGRLAVGGLLVAFSPTASAAMLGVAIAAFAPPAVGALALGRLRPSVRLVPDHGRRVLREVAHNSYALLAFFALSNSDIVAARAFFTPEEAGLYAAGLILTKAVLFLPQFVVVIAFPSMASTGSRQRMYLKALAVTATAGLLATACTAVLSPLAVVFVGGEQYAALEPMIWAFALLGTLYALVQLMVYEVVARQHSASVYLIWAGLAVVVGVTPALAAFDTLVVVVCAVNALVLLALLTTALMRRDAPSGLEASRALA